jgi:hypothetical protein
VTGEPTFEDLKIIRRYLNTNTMSVSSYEGGGQNGHLGLIMMNDEYFSLATDVFTAPENPGATSVHPDNATVVRIAEANRAHTEAIRVYYRTYNNVDQEFKKLIIDAFEDQFLNALSEEVVGYAHRTSLDLLTHILTYDAMIAPTELTQNYERNTPYDPNQPIESLFQKIQDDRAFAIACGQPYGYTMIVNVAYTLVFNTGLFTDACRTWQVRPAEQKTWTSFNIHFAAAHREFRLMNQTSQQSGFHSANMMIEDHHYQVATDAIAQLAVATASDRDTVAILTATNAKLTFQLETSQAGVQKLKEDISQLKLKIKPLDKVNNQPKQRTTMIIVGRMGIKYIMGTQAQVARIRRKATRHRQLRPTRWEESSGAKNDAEGQLRFYIIN